MSETQKSETQKPNFQFLGKYIIEADLRLLTALHIGGTQESFEIGGMDNPVIKDQMTDIPYIPGSSLKGKMRSLLEWEHGFVEIEEIKEDGKIKGYKGKPTTKPNEVGIVFGIPAQEHKGEEIPGPTRLTVCDAYPDEKQKNEWETYMGEGIYTELKTENTIDRLTSSANPRPMERVPAGSVFKTKFIFDVYCNNLNGDNSKDKKDDFDRLKVLFEGMLLLEDSALGGGGSRGSGRVKFENIKIEARHKGYYLGTNEETLKKVKNIHSETKAFVDSFKDVLENPKQDSTKK
ncbi:MAG: type III-A CRISPR-associated RAMP protein Csm3 [Desulfobacteraceae bacterium IS3]|nr:MAG: type III-A CRISPR-associated RAMP protein Csm3 [Desulfobacteraceae bacterium IS3]